MAVPDPYCRPLSLLSISPGMSFVCAPSDQDLSHLASKVVWLSGAASGIGRALALRLASLRLRPHSLLIFDPLADLRACALMPDASSLSEISTSEVFRV